MSAGLLCTGPRAETGAVGPAFELIGVILLPTAAGYALLGSFRALPWTARRWAAWRQSRLAGAVPVEPLEPIERLRANLRRLRAELEATETRTDLPAKGLRLRALRGAYTDALTSACRRLDVSPPPSGDRVPQAEIYRVEAALRQRGLDVRETASP